MLVSYIIVGIFGLLAGGIVNALADDLPHYRRPRLPQYPDGTPRPFKAWLGISAFLLGLRVSTGGSKLSWRYPLAEIGTAVLMMLTLSVALTSTGYRSVSSLQLIFWLIYMAIFVLITVIDLEHKLILFSVMIPCYILAILDAILTPQNREPGLDRAILGGLIGFGVFFLLYIGGYAYVYLVNKLQRRNINEVAFGYGDVMMATFSGLILGPEPLYFAMFITVFLGAGGAILWLISRRLSGTGYSMFTALPYGPYIVGGTIIILLYGAQVRMMMVGY
jgi:prepilin signal peptidase PulO-like enzyme (type II secretory pathway)